MTGARSRRIRGFLVIAILLAFAAEMVPAAAKGSVQDSVLVLEDGVLDLRADSQFREKSGKGIGDYAGVEDLQVGSIFISADGIALKVVAIEETAEGTIIETTKPQIREVVAGYEMPDQQIIFTSANIVPESVQPGVTVLTSVPPLQSGTRSKSLSQGPTWIDTDTNATIQGDDIIVVSLDQVLWQGSGSAESGSPGEGPSGSGISGHAGGSLEASGEASAEIRLKGYLRVANPVLNGGLKMPTMSVRWVTVWWYIGYPEITFESGYLHASFYSAEQIDCAITGTVTVNAEVKIPLYALEAQDSSGSNSFVVGVYLKISVDGSITVGFEINEYARLGLWGTVDLAWPFIPYDVSMGSDFYYNFAVRPSIAAEVEAKAGPFLGLEGTILGMDILTADIGGGIYANVSGLIEAKDVIGLDQNVGGYGSWANWYYKVQAEIGGFLEANLGIATWSTTLLDQRWPFLQIESQGGF